jgi:hypothetical protein
MLPDPMKPRSLLVPIALAFLGGASSASAHPGHPHPEAEVDEFEEPDAATVSRVAAVLAWGTVLVAVFALSRRTPAAGLAG